MLHRFHNLILAALLLSGCAIVKSPIQVVRSCESTAALAAFQTSVYAITSRSCYSCHAQTRVPLMASTNIRRAYSQALTAVDFDNPASSLLARKVEDGHCGAPCDRRSREMIAAIEQWKKGESENKARDCKKKRNEEEEDDGPGAGGSEPEEFTNPRTIVAAPVTIGEFNAPEESAYKTLVIPLPNDLNGTLRIEIQRFSSRNEVDSGSYRVRKPRLYIPTGGSPLYIKNIGVSLNDHTRSVFTMWHGVDTAIAPAASADTAPILSPIVSNPIPQDRDTGDQLVVSFEILRVTDSVDCKNLSGFQSLVLSPPAGAALSGACRECHGNGHPRVSFATGTPVAELCRRVLQRVNRQDPNQSALIRNPAAGANGHPATSPSGVNLRTLDYSRWIQWIESERD